MIERKKRWPLVLLIASLAFGVAVVLCLAGLAMQQAERLAALTPPPSPVGVIARSPASTPVLIDTAKPPIIETPTVTLMPAPTGTPTATPAPTNTPSPTVTPVPTKALKTKPDVLAEINGNGETVTDSYPLPTCQKAVFYWEVTPKPSKVASLIVHLHKAGEEQGLSLVNAVKMDVPDKLHGSTLQSLSEGKYYLRSKNTTEAWSVCVECQDDMAPAASGLDLQGDGDTVSANYALPACQKSVFSWSVAPNSSSIASLIVHLYKAGDTGSASLVNALKTDQSSPLYDKALQQIPDGLYYVTVENMSGPWQIWWECQD